MTPDRLQVIMLASEMEDGFSQQQVINAVSGWRFATSAIDPDTVMSLAGGRTTPGFSRPTIIRAMKEAVDIGLFYYDQMSGYIAAPMLKKTGKMAWDDEDNGFTDFHYNLYKLSQPDFEDDFRADIVDVQHYAEHAEQIVFHLTQHCAEMAGGGGPKWFTIRRRESMLNLNAWEARWRAAVRVAGEVRTK